jgi:hypothetical protein
MEPAFARAMLEECLCNHGRVCGTPGSPMSGAGHRFCARDAIVCGLRSVRSHALVCAGGLQAEGYGDGFGGFNGLAIEGGGLVMPLADGVCGSGDEQRRT